METTLWGAEHLAFLRRFYRYENGIPSHDTLCDVFAALDPELFKACFLAWINDLRDEDPDIESSTQHWEQQRAAMPETLRRHDELLRTAIEARGGYVFKTVGDEFCAAFSRASDAVAAAADASPPILNLLFNRS